MSRWSKCPGSVRLSVGIKSIPSSYAEEGTRAHEIAAKILNEPKARPPFANELMDEDTLAAILLYVDYIRTIAAPGAQVLIEHAFDLSKVHPGLFGTADVVVYLPATKTLHVVDYKHGAGIPVEVEGNPQLLYYALGALFSLKIPIKDVVSTIVQPRCNHAGGAIRSHTYDAEQVLEFAADLVIYAKATEAKDAPLVPGDHCRFCPAIGICPALKNRALSAAKNEFRQDLSYDPKTLSETLSLLDAVEDWAKGVRAFAYAEAQHGRTPPGWKLVAKRAVRKWKSESQVQTHLETFFRDDVLRECFTDPALKSPAQIEKIVGKKEMEKIVPFIVAESSGLTLAPEHDKREGVKADASVEFSVLE